MCRVVVRSLGGAFHQRLNIPKSTDLCIKGYPGMLH
jgi:hypothetical protein